MARREAYKDLTMINKEIKKRLADYFEPEELVNYLGLTAEDLIDAFEADVEEALDDLEDIMGFSDDDEA